MNELADAILDGQRGAVARGVTVVENGGDEAVDLLDAIWRHAGHARRIGITGPPGVGKSTLIAALLPGLVAAFGKVGVVAVDPTSPFSGGALLGDRYRAGGGVDTDAVFFRSLASRGSVGGLSRAAPEAMDLLDAAGFPLLLLETVGVGQTEIAVASHADTVVVVLSPESGDGIQAMKAGLLEIADVLCVNKADRDGADDIIRELERSVALTAGSKPAIVRTRARDGHVEELVEALQSHATALQEGDRLEARRRAALGRRLRSLVADLGATRVLRAASDRIDVELEEVASRRCTLARAAARVLAEVAP